MARRMICECGTQYADVYPVRCFCGCVTFADGTTNRITFPPQPDIQPPQAKVKTYREHATSCYATCRKNRCGHFADGCQLLNGSADTPLEKGSCRPCRTYDHLLRGGGCLADIPLFFPADKMVSLGIEHLMQVPSFVTHNNLAVVTVMTGRGASELAQYTVPQMRRYAEQCGADFHAISDCRSPDYPMANKFRASLIAREYDRTLFVDVDAFIRPGTPNIFDTFAPGYYWAHQDSPHNDHVQNMVRFEVKMVGGEECSESMIASVRCRNSGVVLMDRQHARLWEPPARPLINTHCAEQSWIEFQLLKSGMPIGDLPPEWNTQYWWSDFEQCCDASHIVHFAGCSHRTRIRRLKSLTAKKIVVLKTPRTGGHLLVDSLATHPFAKSVCEVFDANRGPLERSIDEANLFIVRPFDRENERYADVLRDATLVYLHRKDRGAQLASWKKACESGKWMEESDERIRLPFDPGAEEIIEQADRDYRPIADVVIAYEDMIADWDATISRILAAAEWKQAPIQQMRKKMINT